MMLRLITVGAVLGGLLGAWPAVPPAQVGTLTGKERLSDKASDEQRVDDCKVPAARRTRARPTACPWDAGT